MRTALEAVETGELVEGTEGVAATEEAAAVVAAMVEMAMTATAMARRAQRNRGLWRG